MDPRNKQPLGLFSSSAHVPRKVRGGKDFHFIDDGLSMIGIFDGVGEWLSTGESNYGVYPRELMRELQTQSILFESWKSNRVLKDEPDEAELAQKEEILKDSTDKDIWDQFEKEGQALLPQPREVLEELLPIQRDFADRKERYKKHITLEKPFYNLPLEQGFLVHILMQAQNAMHKRKFPGVSTALLLMLQQHPNFKVSDNLDPSERWLYGAVVGDSAFLVIRDGKKMYRSSQHYYQFDHPYHFGNEMMGKLLETDIQLKSVRVKRGDIIVSGSDGLFDNMWDHEIVEVVNEVAKANQGNNEDPVDTLRLAEAIVDRAHQFSRDDSRRSPYGEYAERETGYLFFGGREDDITAIVSRVVPLE